MDANESGFGRALMSGTEKVYVRASLLSLLSLLGRDCVVDFVGKEFVDKACTESLHDSRDISVRIFGKALIILENIRRDEGS